MICHKWNISKNIVISLPLSVLSTSVLIKNLTSHTVHWYEHQVRYLSTRMGVHLPLLIFCLLLLCCDLEAAVKNWGKWKSSKQQEDGLGNANPNTDKRIIETDNNQHKKKRHWRQVDQHREREHHRQRGFWNRLSWALEMSQLPLFGENWIWEVINTAIVFNLHDLFILAGGMSKKWQTVEYINCSRYNGPAHSFRF